MLRKVKGSLYRLVRTASDDAVRESVDGTVVPEIGDAKRLLAEYVAAQLEPLAHESAKNRDQLIEQRETLDQVAALQREALGYVAEELRRVGAQLEALNGGGNAATAARLLHGGSPAVEQDTADLINAATASAGALSDAGLFFNLATWVTWHPDGPRLTGVNERIAEIPFVLRALADLPEGARVLDIGSAESTVPASLATLGYAVTAVDPRGYPIPHPNLRVVESRFDDLAEDERYDAVVSLSSIEHFGIASYAGDVAAPDADRDAVRKARRILVDGGLLVLTLPYGRPRVTELERIYGPEELDALLDGFTVVSLTHLHRVDELTWALGESIDRDGCAMIVARA